MRDSYCYDEYCEIDKSFIVANILDIDTFEYVTQLAGRSFLSFISHQLKNGPTGRLSCYSRNP